MLLRVAQSLVGSRAVAEEVVQDTWVGVLDSLERFEARAQRTVIGLRDVEGWTPEEVCEVLEISAGNQRVPLHRARARVRAAVEAYLGAVEVPSV